MTQEEYYREQIKLLKVEHAYLLEKLKEANLSHNVTIKMVATSPIYLAMDLVVHKINFLCYQLEKLK